MTLSAEDVRRVCGPLSDQKVASIIAIGGDLRTLELALAWSIGDDEHSPERHISETEPAGRILDILLAGEDDDTPTGRR